MFHYAWIISIVVCSTQAMDTTQNNQSKNMKEKSMNENKQIKTFPRPQEPKEALSLSR